MSLTAAQIFSTPRELIWNIEEQDQVVVYADGKEVLNRKKDIIFNRYCWELFQLYPQTPIVSACDVQVVLNGGFYNADTHIKTLETVFKHICEYNQLHTYAQKDSLLKAVYMTVNLIYNEIVNRVSDSVSTIDATDFVTLITDDKIKAIHDNLKPTPESVERGYKDIKAYINNATVNNRFVSAYRSKSINDNQANQCIGPRGFVTELDRTVFRQPILNGFFRGMGNLYELITESRTAAKSLNANDTHIKISEYASRRIQLLTMSVQKVDVNDCGSTDYMDLYVTESYLPNMKGKYYVHPDTGILDYIRGNEKDLVNRSIKLRTAFGCHAPNITSICRVCLGKVSENFKENTNLGYTMTAHLMEKLTQTILSTKHLTHSVKKALIHLTGAANKYFYTDEENHIYLNKDLDLTGLYLILPNSKLTKLVDVLNLQHTNIALSKVGELETVAIRDIKHKVPFQETVDISYRDRQSIITRPLLEYIKNTTLESDSRGNFVVPLENFDKRQPIFYNPLKETNIISFVNKIASVIETNKDKVFDPYEKFMTLFNSVIEQFNCNMSVIEVIVYATTTYNAFNNNYRLGRNSVHPRVENKTLLFRHRSISQLLVYEEQQKEILNHAPVIFSNVNRMGHPMDALFGMSPTSPT